MMHTTDRPHATAVLALRRRFFAAFYNRDFRFLWSALICTTFIQRMDGVILGWLMLEMTHSAFLVGLIIAVRRLGALLGPWAGVVADRVDRRHLSMTAIPIMGLSVLTLAILVALRRLEVWHLFATSIINGIVWAFMQPTQQSMQADILQPSELPNGVALGNMAMNLTTIVAPAFAGVVLACCRPARQVWDWSDHDMVLSLNWLTYDAQRLYATTNQGRVLLSPDQGISWHQAPFTLPEPLASALALDGAASGVQWAYVAMVALYTLQLVCYVFMHPLPKTGRRASVSIWQNLQEGLSYSVREAGLWTPLLLAALVNFATFPLQSNLLPVFARDVFSVGAPGLGWLVASMGMGALLGSLFMIHFGTRYRTGVMMLLGTLLWGGFELILAFTPHYEMALVVLVLTGMAQAVCLTSITLMLLSRSTTDMRGRVMGLRSMAVAPLFLGSLLSGAVAEQMGAPMATLIFASIGIAVTLFVMPWVPK